MPLPQALISELAAIFDEEFGTPITLAEAEEIGDMLVVVFGALSRCKHEPI
ncbi:MAG: hypothetical protein JST12_14440 [Armatimonadetes bacterium]|nr:hypothetical protein [Armatimonadota bacterium]